MAIGLGLALGISLAEPVSAADVRMVMLQPLPGAPLIELADVNNSGTVFGNAGDLYRGYRAVRWDRQGRVTLLASTGGISSWVSDSNDAGVAVGWENSIQESGFRAVRWMPDGRAVRLELPPGARGAQATTITEDGVILGMVTFDNLNETAARWDRAGRVTVLQRPPDTRHSYVLSIAADGTMTGYAYIYSDNNSTRPLRWDRHGQLAQVGVDGFRVRDANSRGIAVGVVGVWPDYHPARWGRSGRTRELGRLTGGPAFPTMVNDSGVTIGNYPVGDTTMPIMWDPAGRPTALTLLPGFTSGRPESINRHGMIAGLQHGRRDDGGFGSAVVRWDRSGRPTALPSPPNTHPRTVHDQLDLNDRGDVIGVVLAADDQAQAVLWLDNPRR